MEKRLSKEIKGIFALNTFVKAKSDSFTIEKLILSFVKTENKQSVECGNYYLDFGEALVLCEEIINGSLKRDIIESKQEADAKRAQYARWVRNFQGGVPSGKAGRSDRKALSRVFTIVPGNDLNKYPIVFKYEEGPGEDSEGDIITPLWWKRNSGYRFEKQILVPMTYNSCLALALLVKAHIEGYIANCYADGTYYFTPDHLTIGNTDNYGLPAVAGKKMKTKKGKLKGVFRSQFKADEKNEKLLSASMDVDDGNITVWVENNVWGDISALRKEEIIAAIENEQEIEIKYVIKGDKEKRRYVFLAE